MMAPLWFQNGLAYCLQVALVAAVGLAAPRLVRLRRPRVLHVYWQVLLAACLLLPLVGPWRQLAPGAAGTAASRIFMDSVGTAAQTVRFPVAAAILVVLTSGMALRLAWLGLGCYRLAHYRRAARSLDILPTAIRELAARLGVAAELAISEEVQSPATFGLRRPVILLPPQFMEMDADRQCAIAGHEMLHVARRDWAFHLAEEVILAGFWFHPAVWWVVRQARLSREQWVDRQVVALTGARKPYLYALVEIAAGAGAARALLAPAFLDECQLAERIRALAKEDGMSKGRIALVLAGAVVLTLAAGFVSVRVFPLKGRASGLETVILEKEVAAASPNVTPAPPNVYTVGNGVSAPVPIYKPEPPYTPEAKAAKIQGSVAVQALIGADGNVTNVTVINHFDKGLTQNAVDAIKTWKFKPAMKDGKPVACKVRIEVSFKLF